MSNLPPGCPSARHNTVPHTCVNEDCPEHRREVEVEMVWELGGYFYRDEERDAVCEICEQELEAI